MEMGNFPCLLYHAHQECKRNLHPFYEYVSHQMYSNDLGNLIEDINTMTTKCLRSIIKQNISEHKFRMLKLCRATRDCTDNSYLRKITNGVVRKNLVNLRLYDASSYLSPEQYDTHDVTRNTKHLVLECDKTVILREGLFKCIKSKEQTIMRLNEQGKLQNMGSEKAAVIIAICSFVKKTLQTVNNAEWVSCIIRVLV